MTAADTLVVVNPASAAGRTGAQWPRLARALDTAGVAFDHAETSSRGDAEAVTREALLSGVRRVVAVGGDGTLNEVLAGFFGPDGGGPVRGDAVLGLIPSGSGGDFRRTAGIPADPEGAAAVLARDQVRRCDVGRIRYHEEGPIGGVRHFLNVADCGLGGEVVSIVNASRKRAGATATFYYASVRALLSFGRRPVRLEIDGAVLEGRMQNVVLANGRYFGSGMRVAPHAELDDGLLDVVVIGDIGRLRSVAGSRRIYRGTHIGRPGVIAARARRVTVIPLDPRRLMPFDVDGEALGRAPATISVLPGAIGLCAPPATGVPVPRV